MWGSNGENSGPEFYLRTFKKILQMAKTKKSKFQAPVPINFIPLSPSIPRLIRSGLHKQRSWGHFRPDPNRGLLRPGQAHRFLRLLLARCLQLRLRTLRDPLQSRHWVLRWDPWKTLQWTQRAQDQSAFVGVSCQGV